MNTLIYIAPLAAGLYLLIDIYIFGFDQYTEKELIRFSFFWVPLILFGLLGLLGRSMKKISNHLLFAAAGTLLGLLILTGYIMLVFL
jgi:hypothetical protein